MNCHCYMMKALLMACHNAKISLIPVPDTVYMLHVTKVNGHSHSNYPFLSGI